MLRAATASDQGELSMILRCRSVYERVPYGRDEAGGEGVIRESEQQAALADACATGTSFGSAKALGACYLTHRCPR